MIPEWSRSPSTLRRGGATLYTFVGLLLLVFIFALRMVRPYLLAILMGAILAVLGERGYQFLLCHRLRPQQASFIVTSAILSLILTPISAFILVAVRQGTALGEKLSNAKLPTMPLIMDFLSQWPPLEFWVGDPANLENQMRVWLQSAATGITSAILSFAANLPAFFLQILLACLSCYFLLIDGRRFILWAENKVPVDWDVRNRLIHSFRSTAISVILASVVSAAVQAVLVLLSFFALGIPLAFLAAGATFIFAWIPIVGSTPIWITPVIYLYFQGDVFRAIVMFIFGLVIGISDNFVRPWVLGGRSSLHPLVTLVAIFGGIQMFGYVGVFVGPILMAILISLLQVWPDVAHRFGLVFENGPPTTSTR